ncbi:MAG: cadherin repeat domain-containing protein [Nanoarchaeota archaeon]|nr:cadherin repeat domain-containing protein [Nanoarchaeota archaeon]
MRKLKKEVYFSLGGFVLFAIFLIGSSIATQSGSSESANLTILDDTDSQEKYSLCQDDYCANKNKASPANYNFYFNANYTNSSGAVINVSNGNGNCTIRINQTGSYGAIQDMAYNASNRLWQLYTNLTRKGNMTFDINCTSSYGNVSLVDEVIITNTIPYIIQTAGGYVDFDGDGNNNPWQCSEDTICYYNFSSNVSEDDLNDVLNYSYDAGANTTLTNFSLNSQTGLLTVNYTSLNSSLGLKRVELGVRDSESALQFAIFEVNITAVNDAPNFTNLTDLYFNMSTSSDPYVFEHITNVTDEENNFPYSLNISFLNCSVANWSSRNCSTASGRELFNSSQYRFNATSGVLNISFSPQRNDVGNYTINFTITDLNNQLLPYNASTSKVVHFNVLSRNTAPSFTYLCEDARNGTENTVVICYINATDLEEQNNITYSANYSWFKFNGTDSNYSYGNIIQFANATDNFTSYALVNFTPTDEAVGNWTINLSLLDTGSYGDIADGYSQYINFTIININDLPVLSFISNLTGANTVYTSNTYQIPVNASDDDILIIDKSIHNETLNFTVNVSWINFTITNVGISAGNLTRAMMHIYPDSSLSGNHSVLINATDQSNASISQIILIEIINNTAPVWGNMSSNITELEGDRISINLTSNITDIESNSITFSYINLSYFPSFSLNASTGVINFTTNDLDVGEHIIIVNASDNIAQSSLTFNFSIVNLNETPSILTTLDGVNVTVNGLRINTTEDTPVRIYLLVDDEDLKVLQKSHYNESLSITTTLVKNDSLSNLFTFTSYQYPYISNNRTQYLATFTANKSDVGNYTVRVNITDYSGLNSTLSFNVSIAEVQHVPSLFFDQSFNFSIYERFYLDVNATDVEDGSEFLDSNNTNFTYSITNLTEAGNFLAINSSTGIITNLSGSSNFSLNESSSYPGDWNFNVTARDSSGFNSSRTFNIKIYDYPQIYLPNSSYNFYLAENVTSSIDFTANHSVRDNLNYSVYIRNNFKISGVTYGNGSVAYLNITPNFTDETGACAGTATILLNVSNQKLSNTTSWNITINHTNYPIRIIKDVSVGGSINISGTDSVTLYLNEYFEDIDAIDTCHNQTIGFKQVFIASNGSNESDINVTIVNWTNRTTPTINFAADSNATAYYYLNISEFSESDGSTILTANLTTNKSNTFIINILESTTVEETPASGGGSSSGSSGGGTTEVPIQADPILLKLLLPDPVSVDSQGKIILPISLVNDGVIDLKDLSLYSIVSINGSIAENITSYFDRDFISSLLKGKRENFTLTVDVDTELEGLYEITVNVSVKTPEYFDWGKIYMNVKKGTSIKEKFVFIEELMVSNPECIEIKELVNRARDSLNKGDLTLAEQQITEAIDACGQAITQKPNPGSKSLTQEALLSYVSLSTLAFLVMGIVYYLYRRGKFMREANLEGN